jgi:hypothetical protein
MGERSNYMGDARGRNEGLVTKLRDCESREDNQDCVTCVSNRLR